MIRSRVLPGLAMAAAWGALLFLAPARVFWGVLFLLSLVAAAEYLCMHGLAVPVWSRITAAGLVALPVFTAAAGRPDAVLLGMMGALVGGVLLAVLVHRGLETPFVLLQVVVFGAAYVGLGFATLVLVRYQPQGDRFLLLLTAITAASDTAAFYTGRAMGRRRLCPAISGAKTVEGLLGGLLGGLAGGVLMAILLGVPLRLGRFSVLAPLLILAGVYGDLAESLLKRSLGVKDSSRILAGHGGLLDRIDSLLLAGIVLYLLLATGILP